MLFLVELLWTLQHAPWEYQFTLSVKKVCSVCSVPAPHRFQGLLPLGPLFQGLTTLLRHPLGQNSNEVPINSRLTCGSLWLCVGSSTTQTDPHGAAAALLFFALGTAGPWSLPLDFSGTTQTPGHRELIACCSNGPTVALLSRIEILGKYITVLFPKKSFFKVPPPLP